MTLSAANQRAHAPGNDLVHLVYRPVRDPGAQARHDRLGRLVFRGLALAVPVLLLLLWELSARLGWIDPRLFPAPSTAIERIVVLAQSGDLWKHTAATLSRVLLGYVFGTLSGVVVGAVMGRNPVIRAALHSTLQALYVIPVLALFPVLLTIFGLGEAPMVALVAFAVFFFVWVNSLAAYLQIPSGYLDAARSLDLGRRRTFFAVLLPASLPQLFVGLKVGMNVAILVTVAAEFVVGNSGLGYVINNAREIFVPEQMYGGIICVSVLGVVLAGIVNGIGRLLTPWTKGARK